MIKLSSTAITTYEECPKKYKLKYIERYSPIVKGNALAFGSAIDAGLERLLLTKDINKARFSFTRKWLKESRENTIKYGKDCVIEPCKLGYAIEWLELQEKGYALLKAYEEQILPRIDEVISTQITLQILTPDGDVLKGIIDLIAKTKDGKVIIFDNKTTSVKYTEQDLNESKQLALYKWLAEENSMHIDEVGYLVLNKKIGKKGKVNTQFLTTSLNEDHVNNVVDKTNDILHNIKQENFIPNFNGCKSYYGNCDFYDLCHNNDSSGLVKRKKK